MKTFQVISGMMVLSDPCYELGTWCQHIVENVKNGTWVVQVERSDEDRIATLVVKHEDIVLPEFHKVFDDCGVDSGQFGFFDYRHYRDDQSISGLVREANTIICEDEPFYSFCCDRTLNRDSYGTLPYGAVSSSGWGDGSYCVEGYMEDGQYVMFKVVFIGDEAEDEEYYDDEDFCLN